MDNCYIPTASHIFELGNKTHYLYNCTGWLLGIRGKPVICLMVAKTGDVDLAVGGLLAHSLTTTIKLKA